MDGVIERWICWLGGGWKNKMNKFDFQSICESLSRFPNLRSYGQYILRSPTVLSFTKTLQPYLHGSDVQKSFSGRLPERLAVRHGPFRGSLSLRRSTSSSRQGNDLVVVVLRGVCGGVLGGSSIQPRMCSEPTSLSCTWFGEPVPKLNYMYFCSPAHPPARAWEQKAMIQFEWHDGTVKNIHVDPPFLYEYQVSDGFNQSENGVQEAEMGGRFPGLWSHQAID